MQYISRPETIFIAEVRKLRVENSGRVAAVLMKLRAASKGMPQTAGVGDLTWACNRVKGLGVRV